MFNNVSLRLMNITSVIKFSAWFICTLIIINSCKKESFITDANAVLFTSEDTLHFDTVFASVGSVTQSFKIFNPNDQKLQLSRIALSGGSSSAFKMNVDGSQGTSFSNITIEANDSIYVFVSVTINQTTANLPFIVQDCIMIEYNTNTTNIQLDAYGKNANFINNAFITKDTAWNNELPYVITGALTINEGKSLTINKGVRIYCHADAAILVNGAIKVNGEKYDSTRVIFSGDRLDEPYVNFPASWPGIFFSETSLTNELHYATLQNATQGLITQGVNLNNNEKIKLYECIFNNIYDVAIYSVNSSIYAQNCLISNCGGNNLRLTGGNYNFIHCTVVSYSSQFLNHITPLLFISDQSDSNELFPVNANFTNCIFYGESGLFDDEQNISRSGLAAFEINFTNTLYKGNPNSFINYTNCIQNTNPQFLTVDAADNIFNFHLQSSSPCINTAVNTSVDRDLDGNIRSNSGTAPDIGCYESQ